MRCAGASARFPAPLAPGEFLREIDRLRCVAKLGAKRPPGFGQRRFIPADRAARRTLGGGDEAKQSRLACAARPDEEGQTGREAVIDIPQHVFAPVLLRYRHEAERGQGRRPISQLLCLDLNHASALVGNDEIALLNRRGRLARCLACRVFMLTRLGQGATVRDYTSV